MYSRLPITMAQGHMLAMGREPLVALVFLVIEAIVVSLEVLVDFEEENFLIVEVLKTTEKKGRKVK